jgi:CDP-4-dehydro-6-deoxyglucose reductase/3-phenylpropionate/trans-cinnamate dioxygenase ferredoxin reductase subunit
VSFTIRIAHAGHAFPCAAEETVLEAAQRAGLELPYSCRRGVCMTCEARILAGAAESAGSVRSAGSVQSAEAAGGFAALLCSTRPRSDLVVAVRRVARALALYQPREVTARVFRKQEVAPGVVRLHLRFPIGQRVAFRAGQSLEVKLPDGGRRSYSMANPPAESDGVQLHVRVYPGGAFSDRLLSRLAPGDALRLVMPIGGAAPEEDPARPLLLLATGTGFAPVASILEEAARRRWRRPLVLYRGGRRPEDFYLSELAARWAKRLPGFREVRLLSRDAPGWEGRIGRVQDAAAADWPDMTGVEVYAAGSPAMVGAARQLLTARHGLPEAAFHADAFVAAA